MKKTLTILFIIAILLILLERVSFFRKFEEGVGNLTTPVQLSFYAAAHSISSKFSTVLEIGRIRKKNLDLEAQNATLLAENSSLKKLAAENQLLKEELGLPKEEKINLQGARVLGFNPTLTRSFLTLDKGSLNTVKKGDLVVIKNILLGQVQRVKEKTSLVRLLSDPDSKVLGETEGKAAGIVVGDFGSRMKLTKVLLEDKINTGELVLTSGEESASWRIPKGLVIGKITKVKRLEAELFQEAEIEPLIDIKKLEMVFIRPI